MVSNAGAGIFLYCWQVAFELIERVVQTAHGCLGSESSDFAMDDGHDITALAVRRYVLHSGAASSLIQRDGFVRAIHVLLLFWLRFSLIYSVHHGAVDHFVKQFIQSTVFERVYGRLMRDFANVISLVTCCSYCCAVDNSVALLSLWGVCSCGCLWHFGRHCKVHRLLSYLAMCSCLAVVEE